MIARKKADERCQYGDVVAREVQVFPKNPHRPQKLVGVRAGNSCLFRQGGSCLSDMSHGVSEEKASPFTASGVELDSFWGYQSGVETD